MASVARETLLTRVKALRTASDLAVVLTSNPPDDDHDQVAALVRSGLTVVAFATFEGFVSARTTELLQLMSSGPAAFSDLTKSLQSAATEHAVSVLMAEIRRKLGSSEDPTQLIQETARSLASTTTANLQLSPLTLRWVGSNLNSEDIKTILTLLGVGSDPWNQLTMLVRRAGFNVTNMLSVFTEFMRQRHRAAHDSSFVATVVSARALANDALVLAFGFDALASRGARLCYAADAAFLRGEPFLAQNIQFRFVRKVGSKWKEYTETRPGIARKVYDSREEALAGALAESRSSRFEVVVEQNDLKPVSWIASDLP